jgi:S1-C subfamily serine protease
LNYEGNVVQSCIHCHQIGDAERDHYRALGEPIPETVLFPFPHPKTIGLTLDPKQEATVLAVEDGSPAAAAGIQAGDDILTLNGQPLISMADVQWVLHRTPPAGGDVSATLRRNGAELDVTLRLEPDWRQADDISWRSSAWGLRRMVTGGLLVKALGDEERAAAGIRGGGMALQVEHVGQYDAHAAAKRAGFEKGDVIVSYDGRTDLLRDSDLLAYGALHTRPGQTVKVKLIRGGKELELDLPMQE